MTQPPYVPPSDGTNTPDYTWPPAQETPTNTDPTYAEPTYTEPTYTEGSYSQESYVEPVSTVYVADDYTTGGDQSTKDVAKDQASAVKDTAVEQGQHVADVAKDQAGAVKDTAVEQGQHVADVAKDQAGAVKDTAVEQGQHVAEVAKEQVAGVAAEASTHVKDLLAEGLTEVRSQAGSQQKRLATGIHSLAGELDGMASKSDKSGPLTDYAHQAADKGAELAGWLESAEPSDVLDALRSFARRRPVVFLVASGAAGVLAGRLTRGLVANKKDEAEVAALTSTTSTYSASPQYAVEPAPVYVADDAVGYDTTAGYDTTVSYGTTGYDGAAR